MQPMSGEPTLPPSGRGEPQTCPPGCTEATGASTCQGASTGGQGANAVTRPDSRASRWAGLQQAESRRGQGNGPPLLTGWARGPDSSPSPSGAETAALTLLTGSPLSPGSQRSTTAKGRRQQKQRPSPGYREVAQRKASRGTPKVPAMLLRDRALLTGRSLCPERLSPLPALQPDAAPLLARS